MWLGIFINLVLVMLNVFYGRKGFDVINVIISFDDFEYVIIVGIGIGNELFWFVWKWIVRRGEV